jgi:hypothetical protein
MSRDHPLTFEPFQFSSRQGGVAYEWSYSVPIIGIRIADLQPAADQEQGMWELKSEVWNLL